MYYSAGKGARNALHCIVHCSGFCFCSLVKPHCGERPKLSLGGGSLRANDCERRRSIVKNWAICKSGPVSRKEIKAAGAGCNRSASVWWGPCLRTRRCASSWRKPALFACLPFSFLLGRHTQAHTQAGHTSRAKLCKVVAGKSGGMPNSESELANANQWGNAFGRLKLC